MSEEFKGRWREHVTAAIADEMSERFDAIDADLEEIKEKIDDLPEPKDAFIDLSGFGSAAIIIAFALSAYGCERAEDLKLRRQLIQSCTAQAEATPGCQIILKEWKL